MIIDLKYDIGNEERFINSPYSRRLLILLGFSLFIGIIKQIFNLFRRSRNDKRV